LGISSGGADVERTGSGSTACGSGSGALDEAWPNSLIWRTASSAVISPASTRFKIFIRSSFMFVLSFDSAIVRQLVKLAP